MKKSKITKKVGARKISSAKVTPKKKVAKKKVAAKPKLNLNIKKTVAHKKVSGSKTTTQFKPIGIMAILIGVVMLATLIVLAFPSASSETASNDTSVLGWFSKLLRPKSRLTAPSGLKASSSDGQNTLKWDKVNNATSYEVWRKEGFFGKISVVGYINVASIYTDDTAIPGRSYYYGVTAIKGTSQSRRSRLTKVRTSSLSAPVVDVNNYDNSSYSVSVQLTTTKGSRQDGFYLYCASCVKTKIEISSKSSDQYNYYNFINAGVEVASEKSFYIYGIKKLVANKEYAFQVSRYRIYGGKKYEGIKSPAASFTTPAVSSVPDEPKSFQGGDDSGISGIYFTFDTPTVKPDGYQLNIACNSTSNPGAYNHYLNRNFFPADTSMDANGRTRIDTGDGFVGHGTCVAELYAYFGSPTTRLFSSTPAVHFFYGRV